MSPAEVLDLDVISFNGYLRHAQRVKALDEVQYVWSTFVAAQATGKDVKKWADQLMKDVEVIDKDEEVRRDTLNFLKLVQDKGGI